MERARYRCAVEHGQLNPPGEITFAKIFDERNGGRKTAFGQRVELDDEFYYDGAPAAWMDPLNEPAITAAEAAVKARKRKQVGAENPAPTTALNVPRSGMAGSAAMPTQMHPHAIRDVRTDERMPVQAAPPRRRAKST